MKYKNQLFILTILLSVCVQAQKSNEWILEANNIDPKNYYGITSGNGVIGVVSSPHPFKVKDVVLNGAYDLYGRGRVSNFLKGFELLNWHLDIDGQRLDEKNISSFTQSLDMRNGVFRVQFVKNKKAVITCSYMALRHLPYSVMMHITIEPLTDINISTASIMQAPDALREVENYYNEIDRPHTRINLLTSTAKSPTGKLLFAASNSFIFEEPHGQEPHTIHEMWDNNMHLMKFTKNLKKGKSYNFTIIGSTLTSTHHDDPLNEAERLTIYAKLEGYKTLLTKHNKAWQDLWQTDIIIEGDKQSQKEVRSMMYHLYAFSRANTAYSPSPMGLSGLGYNGHVFWDTELWMYPSLLLLQPAMAKSMINYRLERLPQARHNAFAHGFKGAMFPWESAASGNEETPVWALSGPFEHHITACVGIAAWNYYCVTQDLNWLQTEGFPLIRDIANFWSSRVDRSSPDVFHINNVVAADEWAENVDDNAFTNAAAKATLEYAILASQLLGINPNPDWMYVHERIPILKLPDGTIKEHATYQGEKIKQADVNLLSFPLDEVNDKKAIKQNLDYYEMRVGHGPAMTHAIFSILHSKLGESEKALQAFHDGYRPNLLPPFGVIAETAGGTNPYFATGAGGMLQSILFGFGGLEITPQGLIQKKRTLPKSWKSLRLKKIGINQEDFIINK